MKKNHKRRWARAVKSHIFFKVIFSKTFLTILILDEVPIKIENYKSERERDTLEISKRPKILLEIVADVFQGRSQDPRKHLRWRYLHQ